MEVKSNKSSGNITLIFNNADITDLIRNYLNKQGIDYESITVPGIAGNKYACVKVICTTDDNKTLEKESTISRIDNDTHEAEINIDQTLKRLQRIIDKITGLSSNLQIAEEYDFDTAINDFTDILKAVNKIKSLYDDINNLNKMKQNSKYTWSKTLITDYGDKITINVSPSNTPVSISTRFKHPLYAEKGDSLCYALDLSLAEKFYNKLGVAINEVKKLNNNQD